MTWTKCLSENGVVARGGGGFGWMKIRKKNERNIHFLSLASRRLPLHLWMNRFEMQVILLAYRITTRSPMHTLTATLSFFRESGIQVTHMTLQTRTLFYGEKNHILKTNICGHIDSPFKEGRTVAFCSVQETCFSGIEVQILAAKEQFVHLNFQKLRMLHLPLFISYNMFWGDEHFEDVYWWDWTVYQWL